MDAEEELYQLACQDMPVAGCEVREAMDAYKRSVLQDANYRGLIEMHRPVVRRTPMVVDPSAKEAHCRCCDGNVWRPITATTPECFFWSQAKALGLVEDA